MESKNNPIITVGFCPAWDITNYVDGIEWGQHEVVSSQTIVPAGKSLNISKALAWMSKGSVVTGLWGSSDYERLIENLSGISDHIDFKFTVVEGRTRQNITVVDTKESKEIHLRADSDLTTQSNINKLKNDLDKIVDSGSIVVFAGSMPEEPMFPDCLSIVKDAIDKGADVVIDTSGSALTRIVELGNIHTIKPNLEELSHLLGKTFSDDLSSIVKGARSLCDKVRIVLVSLGENGALVVTKDKTFHCNAKPSDYKVVNSVSCGDYLLAGFISENNSDLYKRLETAVKLATARAWGLTENKQWSKIYKRVDVETSQL